MASVCTLLRELPSAKQIAFCHFTHFANFLKTASKRRYGKEKYVEPREAVRLSTGFVMPAKSLELHHTICPIREQDAEIDEIEASILEIMDTMASPILTFPGISCRMGAPVLAEVGAFSRFDFPDKLLAYAGLSHTTYQSDKLDNMYPYMYAFSRPPSMSASGITPLLPILPRSGRKPALKCRYFYAAK